MRAILRYMILLLGAVVAAPGRDSSRLDVTMDTAQADAALAILQKEEAGSPVAGGDWDRLFATEGFRRLQAREAAMKRPFSLQEFQAFVRSPALVSRTAELAATLGRWRNVDVAAAAGRALAYLPAGARIRATIFPMIKPKPNSFVFAEPDPAIFLALDPAVSPAKLSNTLSHELHHIGFGTACPERNAPAGTGTGRLSTEDAVRWLSAFGEGFAVLAAAGGPDVHPHAVSEPQERARWDADFRHVDEDLRRLDVFFRDILEGRLTGEKIDERGYSFFGVQGPWYTVGYRMAVTIEKAFGRDAMVQAFCDGRRLPETYDRAADKLGLPGSRWSSALVRALKPAR